ncbi:MAG: hypothetical protein HGA85_00950 [Nanoarchaeota archaeon]|nr:hypothetical protein [Nanoarchaeota archaeon]
MRPSIMFSAVAAAILTMLAFSLYNPIITGMPVLDTTLTVVTTINNSCNLTLEEGWNLVSFPCITTDAPILSYLGNYTSAINSVWYYDATSSADPWKSYNPSLPGYAIQDLSTLSRRSAYWINAKSRTDILIVSELFTPTAYSLSRGWNLVGYPSTAAKLVNETFQALEPDYDYILSFNASDIDTWKIYTWNSSLVSDQDLIYASPYGGYWIYMLSPKGYVIS